MVRWKPKLGWDAVESNHEQKKSTILMMISFCYSPTPNNNIDIKLT